mmetsp:Transcript_30299/g.35756  ORF Transcript_30299/g.35756 Transcript_30299/m.35756 type:complete len:114 (+) Transcript_30299:16-357(+)
MSSVASSSQRSKQKINSNKTDDGEDDAEKRQELMIERLRSKGKVMISGDMKAAVNGKIAEVRAYDPKEGRYIAQLPSGQLTTVNPAMIIRLHDPPIPETKPISKSKYAHLKTW